MNHHHRRLGEQATEGRHRPFSHSSTTTTIGLAVLLLASVVVGAPQSSPTAASNNNNSNNNIITIPLVPHRVVQQRRLQLQQLQRDGAIRPSLSPKMERPKYSKYDRRFLADQAVAPKTAEQVAGLYQGYGTVRRRNAFLLQPGSSAPSSHSPSHTPHFLFANASNNQNDPTTTNFIIMLQHYADLWCGSPTPQRQTVIVDTGSGVTAFPCSECNKCGVPDYHIDVLFDGTASQSYRKLACNECLKGDCRGNECSMGMSYAECSSWHAYEVVDRCYIGGMHGHPITIDDNNPDDMDPYHAPSYAFDLKFGCQTSITGLFIQQLADGIMGMDVAAPAFWWQMYAAGKISRKAFSMCFSRSDHATKEGVIAGAMSLGGTDHRLHGTPMIYSKVTSKAMGFYVVTIRKVYLRAGGGGLSAVSSDPALKVVELDISEAALNSQRVIVDSGTTDTYFTTRIAGVFGAAYESMTGKTYDQKTKTFSAAELAAEPTIILQLVGDDALNVAGTYGLAGALDREHPHDILVAIPPEHYYEYDEDEGGYVARFYTDEGSGTVLGANTMMGHELYFDVEGNTIGWSESTCDYAAAVAAYTKDKEEGGGGVPAPKPSDLPDVPVVPPPGEEPAPGTDAEADPNVVIDADDYMAGSDDAMADDGTTDDEMGKASSPSSTSPQDDNKEPQAQLPDFDQIGDGKTNEEQSGTYSYDTQKFCDGLGCQVGVLLVVIASIVIAAYRITRRVNRSYDNLGMNGGANGKHNFVNEMELHEEVFVNYRDKEFA